MRRLLARFLDRMPHISGFRWRFSYQEAFPAGHSYSSAPSKDEILAYIHSRKDSGPDLPGIDTNSEGQLRLLQEYARYYEELPFPEQKTRACRYYYDNSMYSYADAIFLYCFLRKHQPRRIVEVGSGFSSAVMLDTIDRFFSFRPDITLIEPNPDRLKSLLRRGDSEQAKVIDKRIQDVSPELFASLEAGDLLFVDSSHVVKCGSDVHLLMYDILPALPPGVFIHFHDVFYPFDYPPQWLKKGRFWNEAYFLRAFLSYNSAWRIVFFNTYVACFFSEYIREHMPLCARHAGGSLYLQRIAVA